MPIKIPYEENHRIVNDILQKKCNKHNLYFPDEDPWLPCTEEYYHKNKSNSQDGLNTWCKRCNITKTSNNRLDNIDKRKEYDKINHIKNQDKRNNTGRKWRKENPERQSYLCRQYFINASPEQFKKYRDDRKHKNHKISNSEWENCKKYFSHRCAYCGLAIEEHYITRKGITKLGDFHKEHVDHFGKGNLQNCVPSCRSCNSSKWEYNMEEWYKQKDFFSLNRLNKIYQWINKDYIKYVSNKRDILLP